MPDILVPKPVAAGTGLMDMGTGMAPDIEKPISTRTRDTLIRLPAEYTHTRVKH